MLVMNDMHSMVDESKLLYQYPSFLTRKYENIDI